MFLWTLSFPKQMGCRVTICPLLVYATFLILHQGYRPVHSTVTEMGVGPGLLAGKAEMWASESPRTIPPGSGSLEKSSTVSSGSSLVPHGWEMLAFTHSSVPSVEFATLPHPGWGEERRQAALPLPLFALYFCYFIFPLQLDILQLMPGISSVHLFFKLLYSAISYNNKCCPSV